MKGRRTMDSTLGPLWGKRWGIDKINLAAFAFLFICCIILTPHDLPQIAGLFLIVQQLLHFRFIKWNIILIQTSIKVEVVPFPRPGLAPVLPTGTCSCIWLLLLLLFLVWFRYCRNFGGSIFTRLYICSSNPGSRENCPCGETVRRTGPERKTPTWSYYFSTNTAAKCEEEHSLLQFHYDVYSVELMETKSILILQGDILNK